jgi:uncharacterized membrane protein YidH (DUF202 family)
MSLKLKEKFTRRSAAGLEVVDPKARPVLSRFQDYFRTNIISPFGSAISGVGNNSNNNNNNSGKKAIGQILAYNMLGTDLANERTLLAWTRTMLAIVRTAFAYQKLFPTDIPRIDEPSLLAASIIIATLMIMSGLYSAQRYYSVRSMLTSENKPDSYNKMMLWPFISLCVILSILTGIVTLTDGWW